MKYNVSSCVLISVILSFSIRGDDLLICDRLANSINTIISTCFQTRKPIVTLNLVTSHNNISTVIAKKCNHFLQDDVSVLQDMIKEIHDK